MKKEELVAMVGERNIGGWWTSEKIAAIVLWGLTIFFGYLTFVLHAPLATPVGLLMIVAVICSGVSTAGRRVFFTTLKVKRITGRKYIKVIGIDGKTHEIRFTSAVFEVSRESCARVKGRLQNLKVTFVVGSDINEIWRKE